MEPVTHINQKTNKQVYDTLLSALGTSNVPHQWQIFMCTVREELPDILSDGRPKTDYIKKSAIGALGFKSWKEFVDTKVENGGLGLTYSTWRQWSRAWSVIRDLPEYTDSKYSPNEINSMYTKCKNSDEEYPDSPLKYEKLKANHKEEKALDEANSISGLTDTNAQLVKENGLLTESLSKTTTQLTDTQNRLSKLESTISDSDKNTGKMEATIIQKDLNYSKVEKSHI